MDLALDIVLFLHLLGFASLFGGAFVQLRDDIKVVNAAMLYGGVAQVVTGIALVGVIESLDDPLDNAKMGVKLGVALVLAVLCWINRSKERVPHGLFHSLALLTLANAGIAVFW